jgi:hypothetical protein
MYRSLFLILFLGYLTAGQAQNLRGKWVGYFTTSTGLTYPYEIQINDLVNQKSTGNTITKFSNKSSAKASAMIYFSQKKQSVNIIETKFDQLLIGSNMQACLMSNHLTYFKENGREKMQGTYTSNSLTGTLDCGTGDVFLVKEFEFVYNKPTKIIKNTKVNIVENNKQPIAKEIEKKDSLKNIIVNNSIEVPVNNKILIDSQIKTNTTVQIAKKTYQQIPWVIISRDNKLLKKIITKNTKINIALIDNGSFDNDSLSVYDNNVLILDKVKLSYKSIQFELTFNEKDNEHTIILVANKESKSQISSSLMSIKDGMSSDEFYINPNIKSNNKIVIKYQPNPK